MPKGIYKRGKVCWMTWTDPATHQQYFQSAKTASIKEAERAREKWIKEMLEGNKVIKKTCTFKDFLEKEYMPWAWGKYPKSAKSKEYWKKPLLAQFGNVKLNMFNTKMLEDYQIKRKAEGKSNTTVNIELRLLKAALYKAYEWDYLNEEILKKARRVKNLQERKYIPPELSKTDIDNLISYLPYPINYIVTVLAFTGMRKGEVLNLTRDRINLKNKLIYLQDIDTKTNSPRRIPMKDTVYNTFLKMPVRIDIPYVFPNPQTDKPYIDIKRAFHTACSKANIKELTIHGLRHWFNTMLAKLKISSEIRQQLLGHKTRQVNEDIYTHWDTSDFFEAVRKLDITPGAEVKTANNF